MKQKFAKPLAVLLSAGLIAGMGYLGFSVLFTAVMCLVSLLYNRLDLGTSEEKVRVLLERDGIDPSVGESRESDE